MCEGDLALVLGGAGLAGKKGRFSCSEAAAVETSMAYFHRCTVINC